MTDVIMIHQPGGPEQLRRESVTLAAPGPGEALIRHTAIGVNYVDVYHRTGLYPLPSLPGVIGVEAAGVVEALGHGVSGLQIGQRVAWAGVPGGYAAARIIPAARLVPLPDSVDDHAAAAGLLRGLTAHMLTETVRPLAAGETVLIHAAAGGLGLTLIQWAKRRGATVIGAVGSAAKAELARAHGADAVILHREEDFVARARELTDGKGVHVVYDGIGGDNLLRSFDAARPFGMVVSVGQAGGPIPALNVIELGPKRSLALARPSVFAYAADPGFFRPAAAAVTAALADGLTTPVTQVWPLAQAATAHAALESGRTAGAVLLIP